MRRWFVDNMNKTSPEGLHRPTGRESLVDNHAGRAPQHGRDQHQ
jgi:hypothetical protein